MYTADQLAWAERLHQAERAFQRASRHHRIASRAYWRLVARLDAATARSQPWMPLDVRKAGLREVADVTARLARLNARKQALWAQLDAAWGAWWAATCSQRCQFGRVPSSSQLKTVVWLTPRRAAKSLTDGEPLCRKALLSHDAKPLLVLCARFLPIMAIMPAF